MQATTSSQLKAYEDFLILKNFSSATRKMYLRSIKLFLRLCQRKFPSQSLCQELASHAHKDLAFEFGSWISPMFKILLLKEYQRLKEQENKQYNWG